MDERALLGALAEITAQQQAVGGVNGSLKNDPSSAAHD